MHGPYPVTSDPGKSYSIFFINKGLTYILIFFIFNKLKMTLGSLSEFLHPSPGKLSLNIID